MELQLLLTLSAAAYGFLNGKLQRLRKESDRTGTQRGLTPGGRAPIEIAQVAGQEKATMTVLTGLRRKAVWVE